MIQDLLRWTADNYDKVDCEIAGAALGCMFEKKFISDNNEIEPEYENKAVRLFNKFHAAIEELNKLFPEMSADLKWSDKEVWFRSGQRSIVRFLNSHYIKQTNNIMEK